MENKEETGMPFKLHTDSFHSHTQRGNLVVVGWEEDGWEELGLVDETWNKVSAMRHLR